MEHWNSSSNSSPAGAPAVEVDCKFLHLCLLIWTNHFRQCGHWTSRSRPSIVTRLFFALAASFFAAFSTPSADGDRERFVRLVLTPCPFCTLLDLGVDSIAVGLNESYDPHGCIVSWLRGLLTVSFEHVDNDIDLALLVQCVYFQFFVSFKEKSNNKNCHQFKTDKLWRRKQKRLIRVSFTHVFIHRKDFEFVTIHNFCFFFGGIAIS